MRYEITYWADEARTRVDYRVNIGANDEAEAREKFAEHYDHAFGLIALQHLVEVEEA